jgi:hypothetical protein
VKRQLTAHAKIALVCVGILTLILSWSLIDTGHRVADIGTDLAWMLVMMAVVVVLLYCGWVMLGRKDKGLPAFTLTDSATPPDSHDK